jgi:hypothetical protein
VSSESNVFTPSSPFFPFLFYFYFYCKVEFCTNFLDTFIDFSTNYYPKKVMDTGI